MIRRAKHAGNGDISNLARFHAVVNFQSCSAVSQDLAYAICHRGASLVSCRHERGYKAQTSDLVRLCRGGGVVTEDCNKMQIYNLVTMVLAKSLQSTVQLRRVLVSGTPASTALRHAYAHPIALMAWRLAIATLAARTLCARVMQESGTICTA